MINESLYKLFKKIEIKKKKKSDQVRAIVTRTQSDFANFVIKNYFKKKNKIGLSPSFNNSDLV